MNRNQGITLVELLIGLAVSSILMMVGVWFVRLITNENVRLFHRLPLQRDIQTAFIYLGQSLQSARRSTIGNTLADPGFEGFSFQDVPILPNPCHTWRSKTGIDILNPNNSVFASLVLSNSDVKNGQASLSLNSNGVSHLARQDITLAPGSYVLSGWLRGAINHRALLQLKDNPGGVIASTSIAVNNWHYVACRHVVAVAGNYSVILGIESFGGSPGFEPVYFDDISLVPDPVIATLTPGNGFIPFEYFSSDGTRLYSQWMLNSDRRLGRVSTSNGSTWTTVPLTGGIQEVQLVWVGPWQQGVNRSVRLSVTASPSDPNANRSPLLHRTSWTLTADFFGALQ